MASISGENNIADTKKALATGDAPAAITIKIKGKPAAELRRRADKLGKGLSEAAEGFLRSGMLASGDTNECRDYRLAEAARYVGLSRAETAQLHQLAVQEPRHLRTENAGELLLGAATVGVPSIERWVYVTLRVPPSAAAIFPQHSCFRLKSAEASNEHAVWMRVGQWNKAGTAGNDRIMPATADLHAVMVAQGPTIPAHFRFPEASWPLIEKVAAKLKITVGDYLLGAVGYAVWVQPLLR